MNLHARSVATSAGTPAEFFNQVVEGMICSGDVKPWKAHQLIDELQNTSKTKDAESSSDKTAQGTASGKVILLGEHAAVYNRHVLALPIESAVTAAIAETREGINLSIIDWNLKQAELGIMIGDKDYWNFGYGTDAVITLLEYVFTNTKLNSIYLHTLISNKRAQMAFRKAGCSIQWAL